ncbi:type I polyketide synthase [Aspergillus homomorphus CBS 101889]|uniref:Polyketide synthase n=1 Tax=Aspergillus homomorphus (strain CBS 101889) TaxID=1450537 RepID=A0A395HH65_ASPHC|nr:polyketide synthase [Aspergillus homomorphus CBS 101889]RAL06833.1 polyketide synthase [Aspergillus homomorphus CBS 101889]
MADTATSCKPVPIAVVGMGCRFAGGATDPQKLWKLLQQGRSTRSEIPASRFNVNGNYHPNGERLGSMHVRGGQFLDEDPALFDAGFFNMTGEVASCMDPRHRLILEVVYEALEAAGIPLEGVAGSNTAVFGGAMYQDYTDSLHRSPESLPRYMFTGTDKTMFANRVSHFYDLHGPSVTVDTACSTTLTAMHLAIQSLRAGESAIAIVAGANLLLNSNAFITLSNVNVLSPEGISYSFDPRANGYGRGEGVAAIILKTLPHALRDGDPIRLVIRETALNQNGRKVPTIGAPSDEAQEHLIRECYRKAGLDSRETAYVEAHGTGTPTGDPLELAAIAAVFSRAQQPLLVGCMKANIGHTEGASGLASVIKVALALEKRIVPPNATFLKPNMAWLKDKNIQIVSKCQTWPPVDGICRASINNYGFGGANAHAIVERYETMSKPSLREGNSSVQPHGSQAEAEQQGRIYVLSAKDEHSCRRTISRLRAYLCQARPVDEQQFLADMAYTLASRRSKFPWKAACVAESLATLASNLDNGRTQLRRSAEKARLGWVFTGQGAQWYAMGRELIDAYPIFKESLVEGDDHIKSMGARWSILDELRRGELESCVSEAEFTLPLSTAIQIALVRLLWSWNIQPTAITSHSSGEAAAAFAAGALTARAAIGMSYLRGACLPTGLSSASRVKGAMLAVGLGRREVSEYIAQVRDETNHLVVACINSPSSVTVSGDLSAIAQLEKLLNADQIFARRVNITQAFHSEHMRPMADHIRNTLAELLEMDPIDTNKAPRDVIYASPRTGRRLDNLNHLRDPVHWIQCMLEPVEFESAFREMCFDGKRKMQEVDTIIEIGPHGALGGPIKQIMQQLPELAALQVSYLPCLSRRKSALSTMHHLALGLWQDGYTIDLNAVNFPRGKEAALVQVLYDLPTYPWNHQTRYWKEPRISRAARGRNLPVHELIGLKEPLCPPSAHSWQNVLRVSDVPWICDHVLGSRIVFPGAGFISMAIDGLSQLLSPGHDNASLSYILHDVDLAQALMLPADGDEGVDLRLTIRTADHSSLGLREWHTFSIHSITGEKDDWTEHCTGRIRMEVDHDARRGSSIRRTPPPWSRKTTPQDFWASLHSNGICLGPFFQNIVRIERDEQTSWCTLSVADTAAAMPHAHQSRHVVHPTTLDSAFQAAITILPFAGTRMQAAMIPNRVDCVKIHARLASFGAGDKLRAEAKMKDQGPSLLTANVAVFSETDTGAGALIELEGLTFQSLGASLDGYRQGPIQHKSSCSSWHWAPDISLVNLTWLEKTLNSDIHTQEIELQLDLRRCAVHFIRDAVETLTSENIMKMSRHFKKYYSWMQVQLACAASTELGQDSAHWMQDNEEQKQSLRSRVISAGISGEMLCRLGPKLPDILCGDIEPLEMMMDGQLLSRYYLEDFRMGRSNAQASELVRLCCHKNPRSRILEIGGGTGGCTQLVVNALGNTKPVDHYDFTDVSAGFFEAARKRFAEWQDVMEFRKLDIERDPEAQGFQGGSYDVVLASQVLHATSNIRHTLNNVRKLLKPGGRLILVESTNDQLDFFFIFGLLPGWWLSEEPERQSTPSLPSDLWRSVLSDTGFNGVELESRNCNSAEFYMISTIMTTATPDTPASVTDGRAEVTLVHAGSLPPTVWLQNLQLSLRGRSSSLTSIQPLHNISNLEGKICVFLGEVEYPLLDRITNDDFTALTFMLQNSRGALWVSQGATMTSLNPWKALHLGLLRTLRNESNGRRFVSLDLDPSRNPWTAESCHAIATVVHASFFYGAREKDFEFAQRDGFIHVPRALRHLSFNHEGDDEDSIVLRPFQGDRFAVQLNVQTPGLLDSLYFNPCTANAVDSTELSGDWIEVEPRAFGMNFRDIMVAMGQLKKNRVMGFECAGVVTRLSKAVRVGARGPAVGDRVCALMKGHFASSVRTARTNVVQIPDSLSFEQAASIPLAFTTAYISLYTVARLRRGEKVLIHGGAGGVGQAAIILSQLIEAEIFTTAGTQAKREFLIDRFKLEPDHVFSSRDCGFVEGINACTSGNGVDVVLNSLAGSLLQNSFDCLANFGRFVEIGKKDLEQNSRLDMSTFTRNVSFSSVDILYWQEARSLEISRALTEVIRLLEQRRIEMIEPISEYPISAIEKAFRTMQSGKHVGKLVVAVTGKDMVSVRQRRVPIGLKCDASYLIVGGLGAIGRRICELMVDHGARYLIILSRNAHTDSFVAKLQERGCVVRPHSCDVANESQLQAVLQKCREDNMPPVRGIIQAAMVLKDMFVSQMTADDFHTALRPKVQGSWNLHKAVSDVDFFVMLSSVAGVMGNAGQANYAAAGTFQDALAQHRISQGKPAVTIDLGLVKSIGVAAESGRALTERLVRIGLQPMHEAEVLAVLEQALCSCLMSSCSRSTPSAPTPPAVIVTGINTDSGAHWEHVEWMQDARFAGLRYRDSLKNDLSPTPANDDSVRTRLSRVASHQEAIDIVVQAMSQKLMTMFGLADQEMSAQQTLAGMGVDSLVAIELRNWFTAQLNVDISVFQLTKGRTIAEVAEMVVALYNKDPSKE